MKIFICSDPHFKDTDPYDTKNESRLFRRTRNLEIVVDQAISQDVKLFICLGDVFDSPEPTAYVRSLVDEQLQKLRAKSIPFRILVGNHDSTRNQFALMPEQKIFTIGSIVSDFMTESVEGYTFAYLPYRKGLDGFQEWCNTHKKFDPSRWILFGHFGVCGARLSEHKEDTEGLDPELLRSFKHTFLGHYHIPQSHKHYTYPGSMVRNHMGEVCVEPRYLCIILHDKDYDSDICIYDYDLPDNEFVKLHIVEGDPIPQPEGEKIYHYTLEGSRSWISTISAELYTHEDDSNKVTVKPKPTDRNIEIQSITKDSDIDFTQGLRLIAEKEQREEYISTGEEILKEVK